MKRRILNALSLAVVLTGGSSLLLTAQTETDLAPICCYSVCMDSCERAEAPFSTCHRDCKNKCLAC